MKNKVIKFQWMVIKFQGFIKIYLPIFKLRETRVIWLYRVYHPTEITFPLPEGILILIKEHLNFVSGPPKQFISKGCFEETTENCQHRDYFELWCHCPCAKSNLEISHVNNKNQPKVLRIWGNKVGKLQESFTCQTLVVETPKAG